MALWCGGLVPWYHGFFEMAFSLQAFENDILWCSRVHARCFSHFQFQMMRYGLIIAASTHWLRSLQNLIDTWCESLASKYLPCYIVSYQVTSSHFISCCCISWYIIYHMVYHVIEELVRITRGCFFAFIIWRLVCLRHPLKPTQLFMAAFWFLFQSQKFRFQASSIGSLAV